MEGNMTQFQFSKPLPYIILNEQRMTNWTQVLEGEIGATTTMLQINPIPSLMHKTKKLKGRILGCTPTNLDKRDFSLSKQTNI